MGQVHNSNKLRNKSIFGKNKNT